MNRRCNMALWALAGGLCCALLTPVASAQDGQRITVKLFEINGANVLSRSQIEEIKSSVIGRSGTSEELMDTARHGLTSALTSECYIRPSVEVSVVSKETSPDAALMTATVREGTRFSLRNVRVEWARAFSAQQIEQVLPISAMRQGNCEGLDSIEAAVSDFYHRNGYREVKVHSLVMPNGATKQFDVILYIDEGSQSR